MGKVSVVTILKIIAGSIVSHTSGGPIAWILRQRLPFHNVKINVSDPSISNHTKASIFWRLYETDEVRYAQKYITPNEDVIELGASIGVMGSIVSQIQKSGQYIAVEANPRLVNVIETNIGYNRKISGFTLINKAIDYHNKTVSFRVNKSNIVGSINRGDVHFSGEDVTVDTITLNEICTTHNLTNYTLLSDIEGAEITFILSDPIALSKCSKMIIELHDTTYNGIHYTIDAIVDLLLKQGFSVIDQRGTVYVMVRK